MSDVKYGKGELAKALLFHKCIFIRELLFDNTSKFIDILKDITFVKNVPKISVSYTHLRAHETELHLVCRLLLEKKRDLL